MKWKLCITDAQVRALTLCGGSMDEGDGWGSDGFDGYGAGWGYSDGDGGVARDAWSYGNVYGWGYALDRGAGDGGSPPEWK